MRRSALAALPALALALAACGSGGSAGGSAGAGATSEAGSEQSSASSGGEGMQVAVMGADGEELGTVGMTESDGLVTVDIDLQGLEPGFHGFHIHETGECDPEAADGPFTTAGGHYAGDGAAHGEHAGDLPPLLVPESGDVAATVRTDAFTLAELTEGDGSAVMIHEGADNAANIPDRYTSDQASEPGPDEDTLKTGDAGSRVGCGPIVSGGGA